MFTLFFCCYEALGCDVYYKGMFNQTNNWALFSHTDHDFAISKSKTF
jgi:hypothetical protein